MQEEVAIYNLRWFFSLFQLFTIKPFPEKKKKKKKKPNPLAIEDPFWFWILTCFQKEQTSAFLLLFKGWILLGEKKRKKNKYKLF